MIKFIQFLWRCFVPGLLIFGIVSMFTTFDWQYRKIGTISSEYVVRSFYTSTTGHQCISFKFDYTDYRFNKQWSSNWKYVIDKEYDHWEEAKVNHLYNGYVVERRYWPTAVMLICGFILIFVFGPGFYVNDYIESPWSWLYRFNSRHDNFSNVIPEYYLSILKFLGYEIPIKHIDRWGDITWIYNDREYDYLKDAFKAINDKKKIV